MIIIWENYFCIKWGSTADEGFFSYMKKRTWIIVFFWKSLIAMFVNTFFSYFFSFPCLNKFHLHFQQFQLSSFPFFNPKFSYFFQRFFRIDRKERTNEKWKIFFFLVLRFFVIRRSSKEKHRDNLNLKKRYRDIVS